MIPTNFILSFLNDLKDFEDSSQLSEIIFKHYVEAVLTRMHTSDQTQVLCDKWFLTSGTIAKLEGVNKDAEGNPLDPDNLYYGISFDDLNEFAIDKFYIYHGDEYSLADLISYYSEILKKIAGENLCVTVTSNIYKIDQIKHKLKQMGYSYMETLDIIAKTITKNQYNLNKLLPVNFYRQILKELKTNDNI